MKRLLRRPGQVSLERALSKLGLASRTQARELILAGEVTVDGRTVRDPGRWVVPERAKIQIGGRAVALADRRSFVLYKPRGTVTTRSDEKGRPTVFSLIKEPGVHLHAVGRLDWATTGLLILTNDTRLSAWLTDPANAVERVYVVTVRGKVTPETATRLCVGILDEGEKLQADGVEIVKASRKESHLVVRLSEGKNREIRRLFKASGHEVTRLKRVAYGGLELGELESGAYRELSDDEIRIYFPQAPLKKTE